MKHEIIIVFVIAHSSVHLCPAWWTRVNLDPVCFWSVKEGGRSSCQPCQIKTQPIVPTKEAPSRSDGPSGRRAGGQGGRGAGRQEGSPSQLKPHLVLLSSMKRMWSSETKTGHCLSEPLVPINTGLVCCSTKELWLWSKNLCWLYIYLSSFKLWVGW